MEIQPSTQCFCFSFALYVRQSKKIQELTALTNKTMTVLHDNPRWKLTIILLLSGVGCTRWVQVMCMQKEIFYMYKCWGEGGGNNLKPGSRKVTNAICSFVISSQDVHRLKFTYSLFLSSFSSKKFQSWNVDLPLWPKQQSVIALHDNLL